MSMNTVSSRSTVVRAGYEKGWTEVIYNQTTVVEWNQDKIKLNTGGYNTVTTRRRMNQASNQYGLGYRVFQKKGELYVSFRGLTILFTRQITLFRSESEKVVAQVDVDKAKKQGAIPDWVTLEDE